MPGNNTSLKRSCLPISIYHMHPSIRGVDVSLHDTYYIIAHFHFILSLGAIIALFLGILFYQDILFTSYSFIPNSNSKNIKFHCYLSYFGINLTFTPMHFLGFNSQPRRIPDFPDYFNSWNILSSIGSGLTIFAFYYFYFIFLQLYLFLLYFLRFHIQQMIYEVWVLLFILLVIKLLLFLNLIIH